MPAAEENRILLAPREEEATLLPSGEGPGMRESLRLDAGKFHDFGLKIDVVLQELHELGWR